VDDKCIGHFYGHNEKSAEIAENYLTKYKYDNFTKERVYKLVKVHDTPIEPDRILIKKRINRMGKDCFFDLIKIKRADNLAQNLNKVRLDIIDEIEKIATDIVNEDCFTLGSLKINGGDLIKNGFKPGKQLGNILNTLLEEVMEEKIPNEKEALLKRAEELKNA
jgi:tRNA nucleotidyltransferase (CCA-adding enzyme)